MSYRFQVFRNTFLSSVGLYVEYGIGLLTSIVIARTLGPEGFGTYTLVVWLAQLGIVIASGAINQGTIKFVAEKRGSEDLLTVVAVVRHFRFMMTVVAIVISIVTAVGIFRYGDVLIPGYSPLWLFIPWFGMFVRSYYMFYLSVAKGFEDFMATAKVPAIVSPIYLLIVVIAGFFDAGLITFLGIFTVTGLMFLVVATRLVSPHLEAEAVPDIDSETRARMHRHVRIVSTTIILGFLAKSNVESFFLATMAERSDVGFFRVAHRLSGGLALLCAGFFTAVMLPVMAKTLGEGGQAMKRRYLATKRIVLMIAAPLVVFCVSHAQLMINLLYGVEFAPAATVFAAVIFSETYGTWGVASNTYLVTVDRQSTILKLVASATVLKLILAYFLISHYKLLGATIGYVTVSGYFTTFLIWRAVHHQGVKLDFARYFRIILAAVLAVVPCLVVTWWQPNLFGLAAGGILFAAVYAFAILLLRCPTQDDLGFFAELIEKLPFENTGFLSRLLKLGGYAE